MRLEVETPHIEQSADFYEKMFSVGDHGIIFDILRSKMYSNPIQAVCREITSNARDAMREAGKGDQPIQITLPNTLEAYYRVRDTGVGLSPDRVENVFVKYGTSTKREDNTQTGAWGLGAKSPFAVSTEFTVETIYEGVKRNYTCYIDETRTGKMALLSSIPTDQPNSTEIIIPVKPNDFRAFREATEFVCRHWKPLPLIRGDVINFTPVEFAIFGKGWGITKYDSYNCGNVKLIIDGIEYPLDANQLRTYSDASILDAIYGTIYLYFETGELSLSASREAVHLDKRTQDLIAKKLKVIAKGIQDNIKTQIATFPNLWEANLFFNNEITNTYADTRFLGSLEWNGIKLSGSNYTLNYDAKIYEFYRGSRGRRTNPDKIYRTSNYYVKISKESALYLNDTDIKDPNSAAVAQAFEDNPSMKTLQLVCLNEGGKTWDELNTKYHLDKLNAKKLSELVANTKTKKKGGIRFLVFKFSNSYTAFRQVAYDTIEHDTNDKVLCLLEKDEWTQLRGIHLKKDSTLKGPLTLKALRSVLEANPDVSVYGVDHTVASAKIKENLPNFQSIEEFIEEKISKSQNLDYMELAYAKEISYSFQRDTWTHGKEFRSLIKDPKSLYLRYIELGERLVDLYNKQSSALTLYEDLVQAATDKEISKWLKKNPEKDFLALQQEVNLKYPMLRYIDTYYADGLVEPLAHYINLTDKDLKTTSKEKKV